jgi:hypothetical protein
MEKHYDPKDGTELEVVENEFLLNPSTKALFIIDGDEVKPLLSPDTKDPLFMVEEGKYKTEVNDTEYVLSNTNEIVPLLDPKTQEPLKKDEDGRYLNEVTKERFELDGKEFKTLSEEKTDPSLATTQTLGSDSHKIDPYGAYRESIERYFDEPRKEGEILHSRFIVEPGESNKCHHYLEVVDGSSTTILLYGVFDYTDDFKKGLLEPSITDYAERSPLETSEVIQNPEMPERSSFRTCSENNNMLSIANIETEYALNIDREIKLIDPVIYRQMKEQEFKRVYQQSPQGAVPPVGGANVPLIALIAGFFCGLIAWISILLLR